MPIKIKITAGAVQAEAELDDTQTGQSIAKALPITGRANLWGGEIYFDIPVSCGEENPQEMVEVGALAYWPPGKAFCIFFGPTPASQRDEIRPASAVNVIGRILGEASVFRRVGSDETVKLEAI